MPESFGVRLRQRREEQGIGLASIAEQTKIKLSLLDALERDDVSQWPSGIFRRAYVRAYAHAIGLNPDVVVREFLETFPEPAEVVEPLSAIASATRPERPSGPPTRLRYLLGSALESVSRLRRPAALKDMPVPEPVPVRAPSSPEPHAASDRPPRPHADTIETERQAAGAPTIDRQQTPEIDFVAVATVCAELGRAATVNEVQHALHGAAAALGATGVVVWVWDARSAELRALLVHGYSDTVLAQLPAVRQDSDNATAAAFRSAQTCAVSGGPEASGALVVPLTNAGGCGGVLAIELPQGRERTTAVRAAATIFAAVLGQLIGPADADANPSVEVEPADERAAKPPARSAR